MPQITLSLGSSCESHMNAPLKFMCFWFFQLQALEMQGKHVDALGELSKICLLLRIFPPEESSVCSLNKICKYFSITFSHFSYTNIYFLFSLFLTRYDGTWLQLSLHSYPLLLTMELPFMSVFLAIRYLDSHIYPFQIF